MLRYILTVLLLLAASPVLAQQEMRSSTKGASTPLPITGSSIDADHNALDVKCLSGCSGGGGGGTQYTEDGASAGGESLTLSGAVRRDTAASSSTTDGDYSTLNTDSTGRLWTNTELPDAAAASDSYTNPTAPSVLAHIMCYDGSTWLRQPRVSDTDAIGVSGNNCRTATMGWNFNGTSWDRNRGAVNALNSAGTGIQAAQIVGQFDDTSPTAITENQFGNLRMSANRNLYGTIRDAAGNERGANVNSSNELLTNANTELPAAATLADDTANPTVPGVASFNMCFDGTTWDRCTKATAGQGAVDTATQRVTLAQGATACPNYVAISQTADTTLVSGTSSQYFYICSIILVAGAAEVVSLWEGTGTACGTGSTAILGSTTEANGLSLAANGGFTMVSGVPFLRTATTANDICLRQSGTNRVSGVITYYKAP